MASLRLPGAGQGACFHGQELGGQRGCCLVAQAPGRPGPGWRPRLGGRCRWPDGSWRTGCCTPGAGLLRTGPGARPGGSSAVPGRAGRSHRTSRRPAGSFGHGSVELAADLIGVPAGEQAGSVTVEEMDKGPAGVGSTEPVVQLGEQSDEARTRATSVRPTAILAILRRQAFRRAEQPGQRGAIPRGRVQRCGQDILRSGRVGLPQPGAGRHGLLRGRGVLRAAHGYPGVPGRLVMVLQRFRPGQGQAESCARWPGIPRPSAILVSFLRLLTYVCR